MSSAVRSDVCVLWPAIAAVQHRVTPQLFCTGPQEYQHLTGSAWQPVTKVTDKS